MRAHIIVLALMLPACGRGFKVNPAPGLVEVKEEGAAYDYRAIAPEGVAVDVRTIPVEEQTNLAFWEGALTLRMRELDGYALLEARDVVAADKTKGRELLFGHDEQGKPFLYKLRIFQKGRTLV